MRGLPIKGALTALALLLLAGCASLLPQPAPPPAEIDFGAAPEFARDAPLPRPIRLARVEAPTWLQDSRIHYREQHTETNLLRHYAHHVWVAPPAELLGEHVGTMLRALASPTAGEASRLELRLTRFEQVFAGPDHAYAEVRLVARLHHPGASSQPVQRELHARVPTPADIGGAITGLPAAANRVTHELADWLADQ